MTIISESPNIITARLCIISSGKNERKKREPTKIVSSRKLNPTETSNDQLLPTSR